MIDDFSCQAKNMFVYVGPSIHQKNYEVGEEVASLFDEKYLLRIDGKIYLDVLQANIDQLFANKIPQTQIEISSLCSFEEKDLLHSYRRDGKNSGRALGIIAMKD